jgi:transposase
MNWSKNLAHLRYIKRGGKLGAKRKTSKAKDEAIIAAYRQGASYRELQETFGLSKMSIYRRLQECRKAA